MFKVLIKLADSVNKKGKEVFLVELIPLTSCRDRKFKVFLNVQVQNILTSVHPDRASVSTSLQFQRRRFLRHY